MHKEGIPFLFVIFNIEKFDDDIEFVELDTKKTLIYNISTEAE